MNWSGGSKNRFQSKNSNQRKASSQQQARIPFIDNDATVSLNTNNNGSSSQELKNSLFITTSCYPKPSPSNSSSLFMMTTYAKPSSVVSSNAYQDTNSFMMAQKSSEKPSSKFLLGNKFSNISCGSDSDSDLDSSKLSSTNYSPVFSEDSASGSSNNNPDNCKTNHDVLNKSGINWVTILDSEDERNTGNSLAQVFAENRANLTHQQSFEHHDKSSLTSLNSLSSTGFHSSSPKNSSVLGFLSPKQGLEETSSLVTETFDRRDIQSSTPTPWPNNLPIIQSTPSFIKSSSINPTITQTEDLMLSIPRKHVRFARQQRITPKRLTPDGEHSFTTRISDKNETATQLQHHALSTPKQTEDATEMPSRFSPPQPEQSLAELLVQSPESDTLQVLDTFVRTTGSSHDLSDSGPTKLNQTDFLSYQSVSNVPPEFPSVDGSNASASSLKAKKLPRTKKTKMSPHYPPHNPCHCRVRTVVRKIKIRDVATQTSP